MFPSANEPELCEVGEKAEACEEAALEKDWATVRRLAGNPEIRHGCCSRYPWTDDGEHSVDLVLSDAAWAWRHGEEDIVDRILHDSWSGLYRLKMWERDEFDIERVGSWTILISAARAGREEVVRQLMRRQECPVNQVDHEGYHAATAALDRGHWGTALTILADDRVRPEDFAEDAPYPEEENRERRLRLQRLCVELKVNGAPRWWWAWTPRRILAALL